VTIVSDNVKLHDAYKRKVEYYDKEEIKTWALNATSCTEVTLGALVSSAQISHKFLNAHFDLPAEFYSLVGALVRCYGYYCCRHFKESIYGSMHWYNKSIISSD